MGLLASSFALIAAVAIGIFFLRQYRQDQLSVHLQDRAQQLEEEGEWADAYFYHERYLQFRPEDFDARMRFVETARQLAEQRQNPERFIRLLYESIGIAGADRPDEVIQMRSWLAEQLLKTGQVGAAIDEAAQVIQKGDAVQQADAMRVAALARYLQILRDKELSDSQRQESIAELLPQLLEAIDVNLMDVSLASLAANLIRKNPNIAAGQTDDPTKLADDLMDQLVQHSDEKAQAFIARYRYRKSNRLPGAKKDLDAALEYAPADYDANYWSGVELLSSNQEEATTQAKEFFRKAIATDPAQETAHLVLAQILRKEGDRDGAYAVLTDASSKVLANSLEVGLLRGNWLLADGDFDEAEASISSLKKQLDTQLARLSSEQRRNLSTRLRLLEARLNAAQGDTAAALSLFKSVTLSPEQAADSAAASLARQANQEAAQLFQKLGRWDLVATELDRLSDGLWTELDSSRFQGQSQGSLPDAADSTLTAYKRSRVQAAEAYLRSGQVVEARQQLELLTGKLEGLASDSRFTSEARTVPVEAIEALLEVELTIQLDSGTQRRQWLEFEQLLEQAKKAAPSSERVYLAELRYLLNTDPTSMEASGRARQLLAQGANRFASSGLYWKSAAQAYLTFGEDQQAEEAIERYRELENDPVLRATAWVAFLFKANRAQEAQQWLTKEIETAKADQKTPLQRLKIQLLSQAGKPADALRLATQLAEVHDDRATLIQALGLAIANKDWRLAEDLEEKLAGKKLIDSLDRKYYRSVREINQYDSLTPKQKIDLARRIASIHSERPLWRRGALLAAQYAEAKGDAGEAVKNYELSLALGERRPEILERLTLLLYRSGDYDRARQVIDRLTAKNSVSLMTESLAISTAVKQQRLGEARKLAEESVEQHPEDPARRLWLYNVLAADQHIDEADEVINQARQDFRDNELIWNAFFNHLLRTNDKDKAGKLLSELPKSISASPFKRSLALAQGYELLGNLDKAKNSYVDAVRRKPNNIDVQLKYANMLMRSDASAARQQLEDIVRKHPEHADARRKLAASLAADGHSADWGRIDSLLSKASDSNDVLDQRFRALLLTRRGRSLEERAANCELARRILVGIVEDSDQPPEAMDRLLLAGAYEQEAILKRDPTSFQSAREQVRHLRNDKTASEDYQSLYVTFLLRSIAALADMEESTTIREDFIRDCRDQIADLQKKIDNTAGDAKPLQELNLTSLKVRLLEADSKPEEAIELLNRFASEYVEPEADEAVRGRLILGLGALYSLVDAHELAEPWYRKLTEIAPGARALLSQSLLRQGKSNDAIGLYLNQASTELTATNAASLATVLASSDTSSESFDTAWPAISGALEQHSDDVELQLSVAVLHITRGNEDDAIKLFRRALEIDPNHTLALNNLATLLGERESDRAEALQVIGKAIEVAGRDPALLDTQGTIQLRLGDAEAAIASLEESVVSVNVDPRYYFHLAAAYLSGGKPEQARQALQEARKRGIDKAVLTNADRELMRQLEVGLKTAKTALNSSSNQ